MQINLKRAPSLPYLPLRNSSPFQNNTLLLSSRFGQFGSGRYSENFKVHGKSCPLICGKRTTNDMSSRTSYISFATTPAQNTESATEFDCFENDKQIDSAKGKAVTGVSFEGKPGFASFYHHSKSQDNALIENTNKDENFLLWFCGPTLFIASFVFPSIYLRRILSTIFEDSLLTDFLILFFTEILFYCGVAAFLFVIDRIKRSVVAVSSTRKQYLNATHLGYRISSVVVLVLSVIVPSVTMGLVWPWTGPAASAALAPYLVGIIVQFAFEQYTKRIGSPSSNAVPLIFQIYRLHQLNRATQLVTALSFTVRGAEMTPQNVAINSSLNTLLNVVQFLGIVCIWSLSSFIMQYFSSDPAARRED